MLRKMACEFWLGTVLTNWSDLALGGGPPRCAVVMCRRKPECANLEFHVGMLSRTHGMLCPS